MNIHKTSLWLLLFCVCSRIIPHLPNTSPICAMALLLGSQCQFRYSASIICIGFLLSDIALAGLHGYPIIGSWSLFTYSGMMLFIFAGHYANRLTTSAVLLISSTVGFWVWTNIGSWLYSTMYSHDLNGLTTCLFVAIPFLKLSIVANCLWLTVLTFGLKFYQRKMIRSNNGY